MPDLTIILKKIEPKSEFRELRDIVNSYETGSVGDPSADKFDIVTIRNIPGPKANFYESLFAFDDVRTGVFDKRGLENQELRNSRCWYLDAEELNNPQRTELDSTGVLELTWGQAKSAVRFKNDLILEGDTPAQRVTKSRPIDDVDVTG